MKMIRMEKLLAAYFCAAALPALASSYVVPTGWMNDFAAATNLATQTHRPLVMYWGNIGCTHCDSMTLSVQEANFVAWRQTRDDKYVFLYVRGQNHQDFPENEGAKAFAATAGGKRSSLGAYPFVTFWWPRSDGKIQAQNFTGTTYYMQRKVTDLKWDLTLNHESLAMDLSQMADYYFADALVEEQLAFEATGTTDDRYEIEPETTWVKIPVLRTTGSAKASSGKIKVAYPGLSSKKTRSFTWSAGETRKYVTVYTSAEKVAGYTHTPGQYLTLYLYDASGNRQATTKVYMVEKQPNGPVNPYFVGETEELAFGDWTMDLDLATNTVKSAGGKGTLVFFTGGLWCPHCRPLEADVLETARFREWAEENKLACVTIDNPKRSANDSYKDAATTGKATVSAVPNGAGPTLLRYDLGANGCSGAAYRSRKQISDGAAELVLQRNHTIGYAGGYFNAPSSFRTGYPTIVLLDADGQIRGRFVRCEETGCVYDLDENMERFEEFLKLAETGTPENSYAATTELEHEVGGETEVELAIEQNARYYQVSFGHAGEFTVEETENDSTNALVFTLVKLQDVALEMLDAEGAPVAAFDYPIAPTVATAEGRLVCSVEAGTAYRLCVSSYANASSVRREPDDMSLTASFASKLEWKPGTIAFAETAQLWESANGTGIVKLVRKDGLAGETTLLLRAEGPAVDEGRCVWTGDREITFGEDETEKSVAIELDPPAVGGSLRADATMDLTLVAIDESEHAAEIDPGTNRVTITDCSDPAFAQSSYSETFWRYFANTRTYDLRGVGWGTVSFKRVSGTIPDGLSLSCVDGKLVLAWSPTSSGTYSFTLQIREKRNGKTVKGNTATFTIKAKSANSKNPYVSASTSSSSSAYVTWTATVPLMAEAGDGGSPLAGTLAVSVTSKNQLSAKYQGTEPTAIAFAGGWQTLTSDNVAQATLVRGGTVLNLSLLPDGELQTELTPGEDDQSYFAGAGEVLSGTVSVADPESFKAFKGYYTVQLPPADEATSNQVLTGCGSLRLKMTSSSAYKAGLVTWAGVLPDGASVSGSSRLSRDGSLATLPLFARKDVASADIVGRNDESVAGIVASLREGAATAWDNPSVMEAQMLVTAKSGTSPYLIRRDEVDTFLPLAVWGGAFTTGTSPKSICSTFGYYVTSSFTIDVSRLAAGESGGAVSAPSAKAKATNDGFALSDIAGGTLTIGYTASKGQFSGKAQVNFADGSSTTAKYYGVLMPGWLSCDECGDPSPYDRPFGAGTLYWDEDGVRRSAPVTIKATLK